VYIESRAYVSNLRQKLVCGSPLLAPRMHYYEWYSRALVPGTHFVQVPPECASIVIFVIHSIMQWGMPAASRRQLQPCKAPPIN
jgi:Glycosyl transferase family 90